MISAKESKDTELFITWRKLNFSVVFISQSNFTVPKNIKLSSAYFIEYIPKERKLQQIASKYSSNIEFKDFWSFTKIITRPYLSFVYRYDFTIR